MEFDHVVLVLGKRLVNNKLTREGKARVESVFEHIHGHLANQPLIIFCGGQWNGQVVSEALAMKDYFDTLCRLNKLSFPSNKLWVEERSTNTIQNFRNAANLLITQIDVSPSRMIEVKLASSDYHVERILEIQSLMKQQGLLSVFAEMCSKKSISVNVSPDVRNHILANYPYSIEESGLFLHIEKLTTYRVFLEGLIHSSHGHKGPDIENNVRQAVDSSIGLLREKKYESEYGSEFQALLMVFDNTGSKTPLSEVKGGLKLFHHTLTTLNRRLDPESRRLESVSTS
ncbi:YdcF family protein [Vibrio sp. TRT 21S02]|uniref:YdcF family protein n=1 Tax=Vibrio sp. TRT 21S02 TaxID=3418507 RepID=UPI003CEE1B7A